MVGVEYPHHGVAGIRQLPEELLLDLRKFARRHLESAAPLGPLEGEEALIHRKLRRQELVEEGDVRVVSAHFEDLLLAETEAHVPVPTFVQIVALIPFGAELPAIPAFLDV